MKTINTMKPWIWIFLCVASASAGYWSNEYLNRRDFRAKFYASLSWAIEQRLLIVNQDRLTEMVIEVEELETNGD